MLERDLDGSGRWLVWLSISAMVAATFLESSVLHRTLTEDLAIRQLASQLTGSSGDADVSWLCTW
jgi:hypothetical protein